MSVERVITELVEDRSLEALERLTGSRSEEVLAAIVDAAGEILSSERSDPSDDEIVDELRGHLVDSRPVGILVDALQSPHPATREFALGCLSEIGDLGALNPMIDLLEHPDPATREAATGHLALLTHYDLGSDPKRWREWQARRAQGLLEQAEEDREDQARRLKMQMRGSEAAPGNA